MDLPSRVLLVDDHSEFRMSASAMLTSCGLHVVAAVATAEEALDALTRLTIDVAVVDLMLPGMDGVELAQRLAQGAGPPRVVIVSSYADAALDPRVIEAPVSGFVAKKDLTCTSILALVG